MKSQYSYNGKNRKPTPKVTFNGVKLVKDTDYTVKYSNNKKVGTATILIKGIGNYVGEKTITFEIVKAQNPITMKKSKLTLKVKKDLTKNKKIKIAVNKAQGTVSYKIDKKAKSAKITVSAKGVVTVPKNCKKGTYKITVTAKGNKNYASGKAVFTIVVK